MRIRGKNLVCACKYVVVPPQDLHVTLHEMQVVELLSESDLEHLTVGVVQTANFAIRKVV
jgi:hypothetical protein